jgi:hypothetical protein
LGPAQLVSKSSRHARFRTDRLYGDLLDGSTNAAVGYGEQHTWAN